MPVVTLGWLWNRMREAILRDSSRELGLGGELADRLGIGEVPEDWMPITHADAGLCGGMTFTALDYYLAGRLPDEPAVNGTRARSSRPIRDPTRCSATCGIVWWTAPT